jgi:hypothetical protein
MGMGLPSLLYITFKIMEIMENIKKCKKEITKTRLTGKNSCPSINLIKIAQEYGLDEPGILSNMTNGNDFDQFNELCRSTAGGNLL